MAVSITETVLLKKFATYAFVTSGVKVTPTITWTNPIDIVYGTPLSSNQLDVSASVPEPCAYNPSLGTVLDVGQQQILITTFTPTDTANYTTASETPLINVLTPTQKINQMITFVQDITTPSELDEGSSDGLIAMLQASEKSIDEMERDPTGDMLALIAELNTFTDKVNECINSGQLSSTKGHILIDAANDIINSVRNQAH